MRALSESMAKVYVKTMGCKVNTFDSQVLETQFRAHGHELVGTADDAEVMVVNTCSVTANADREARYLARKARRARPDGLVVFTGCYAQTDSARLAAMDEVDVVVPNEAKDRLVAIVDEGLARRRGEAATGASLQLEGKLPVGVSAVDANRQGHFKTASVLFDQAQTDRTRAFVKAQDGCNGFCAYCLIPYARGASRSVPRAALVAEITRLAAAGVPEVVLTGIHLGDWGRDLEGEKHRAEPFADLVDSLFATPGLRRLRLSSLEPGELSDDLVRVLAQHRELVCDHLHLPLQAGADRTLARMRRSYDTRGYADAVHRFRAAFPDAGIGADVIPGFPGESDEDFEATCRFIEELELSFLHVFPYSKRPNTSAARMPGHLHGDVVRDRAARLRALGTELTERFGRRFIGRTLDVLWEDQLDAQGRRVGHARNYLAVAAAGPAPAPGTMVPAAVKGFVEGQRLLVRPLHS